MANNETVPPDATYLPELMAEKDSIDPSFVHALRLITNGMCNGNVLKCYMLMYN